MPVIISADTTTTIIMMTERAAAEATRPDITDASPYHCQSSSMTSVEPTATVRPTDAARHVPSR